MKIYKQEIQVWNAKKDSGPLEKSKSKKFKNVSMDNNESESDDFELSLIIDEKDSEEETK